MQAAWRCENDGCQLSACLAVLHKSLSTSQGRQAEDSACSGTAPVLSWVSAVVVWSFWGIATGRGPWVRISDVVGACIAGWFVEALEGSKYMWVLQQRSSCLFSQFLLGRNRPFHPVLAIRTNSSFSMLVQICAALELIFTACYLPRKGTRLSERYKIK